MTYALPSLTNQSLISRHEAKTRLHQLVPGSEEYSKIQAALLKPWGIVEIALPNLTYRIDSSPEDRLLGGFGSSEHVCIGEAVQLKGLPDNTPLLVKSVTRIYFHHIVALAGDFYGIAGQAISLPGGDDLAKTQRFLAAFDTLDKANPDQIRRIILEIDQECIAVRNSSLPHHCYSQQMMEKNNAILKIKSDINDLLADNSDHFSVNAQDAYRIGHTEALKVAQEAGKKSDLEGLKRAYALDAFACHFLTDLFAAGHIRNQRGELETFLISKLNFSQNWAKKLAGILTGAQHEKDGHDGLNVANKKGESWRAYGDGHFFAPKNGANKNQVIIATQASADEIYAAYTNPTSSIVSTLDQLIPYATPLNPLPLYSIEGGVLFLYESNHQVEIKTQLDYLQKGLSQALRYLPQKYIDGFIDSFHGFNVQKPVILEKVISPQVDRITSKIWHIIGIATYHQITEGHTQLNEKVNEMADVVKGTYDNTKQIIEKMGKISSQVTQLQWMIAFEEIKTSIDKIKDHHHEHKLFKNTLSEQQLQQAQGNLWHAYIRISRVLSEATTTNGINLLVSYRDLLKETTQMQDHEVKISVTLWFRQILDYQVQAFCMYGVLFMMQKKSDQATLREQSIQVETSLLQQIETNQHLINMDLIYEKPNYIILQLEKSRVKSQWVKTLNQ